MWSDRQLVDVVYEICRLAAHNSKFDRPLSLIVYPILSSVLIITLSNIGITISYSFFECRTQNVCLLIMFQN